MTTTLAPRTFERRIGLLETCILLADVLNDESVGGTDSSSLRRDASVDGLSFVRVCRSFEDGTYLARVAASAQIVRSSGFTVILSEEQLYSALPYDSTTWLKQDDQDDKDARHKTPEQVRALLRSHAAEVRPLVKVTTEQQHVHSEPSVPLALVDSVTIPEQALWETLENICTSSMLTKAHPFQLQQAMLAVMLDTLMGQMYSGMEKTQALVLHARCHLITMAQRLHRQTRQQLVQARPTYDARQGCMTWKLSLGMPLSTLAA